MTSPSEEFETSANHETQHLRLMGWVAAENASGGEVGCGWDLDKYLFAYLSTRGIGFDHEKLKNLLQEHLQDVLGEADFDAIPTQIQYRLESLLIKGIAHVSNSVQSSPEVKEHIPTEELKEFFRSELSEFCSEDVLMQLVQVSHQAIHKAVLQPRHTWPEPLWVVKGDAQIYVVQARAIEEAIAKIRMQCPQETGELKVIQARGVLAPGQVVALDKSLL